MRGVIYRRQSLDRDGNELGIDRQLKVCRSVAAARGLTNCQVITDNSVSASKHGRAGYAELLKLMTSGQVDVVFILRIDRLLRLNDELEELISIVERYPVKVITAEGDIDLSAPQGQLLARILVSVARNEVQVKSQRQRLANAQKASQGLPHGGKRVYGYNDDLMTLRPSEALVLREMARRVIAGHSYKEVAWWANGEGHGSTNGGVFWPINIRNMLTNKRYVGIREYQGTEYPAKWEQVFDTVTWERLQLVIRAKATRPQGSPIARKYLLTGLVFCGKCGMPLSGSIKHERGSTRRVYACKQIGDARRAHGCGGIVRQADALDEWIKECVIARLDTPSLAALLGDHSDSGELAELLGERERISLRINELVDDYATGLLDRAQFGRAKQVAENELRSVESRLSALGSNSRLNSLPAGQSVREAWDRAESEEWRRGLVSALIKQIVVLPMGEKKPKWRGWIFDESRLEVQWLA